MGDGWLARAGPDPRQRAREIGRAHSTFLTSQELTALSAGLRDVVAASWRRSAAARVDPDTDPPVTLTGSDLASYRAEHPLASAVQALRDLMDAVAQDGRHLWALSDTAGRLLWVQGHRSARDRAARMNFVEGALWDEEHAGTNAPGTALAVDHAVQIFATEHFRHTVQAWTCAAAPIHDPLTGQVLGAIDVTGGDMVAHPHSLALVRAAARLAEAQLPGTGLDEATAGPPTPEPVHLTALGRNEAILRTAERTIRLNRRHSEIVFLLAARPPGMTGEELSLALYDDLASQTTLRVELTRLRRVVGGLLQSRPYRLTSPVSADYLDVRAALQRGDVASAVACYTGPLLPRSEAPAVREQRQWLDTLLRSAVIASADPAALQSWTERFGFEDLEPWERLAAVLPASSGRRAAVLARVRELRADYGLA
jgi:GAF domain